MCRECTGLTTVTLRDGRHLDNMPALLAHEMGHIIGANHDGDQPGRDGHFPPFHFVHSSFANDPFRFFDRSKILILFILKVVVHFPSFTFVFLLNDHLVNYVS